MGKVLFMRKGDKHTKPAALPSEYTRLAYIQGDGAAYIDEGFIPNQDTRIVTEVEWPITSETVWLFGARTSRTANMFGFMMYQSAYRFDYNTSNNSFDTSVSFSGRFAIDIDKNVASLNGETVKTATYATFAAPVNMYLFANNNNGTVQGQCTAKLYSRQVYDNVTLIRDYVPCANDSGEVGLYDMVGRKFYGNAGTGAFIGSEVA